ncbi:MAG: class I SAM-dependent methyltransferase, partial [Candidatus Adiutrix sp.]|nr:class I SAM-dependent methyltransferase [Candidatus Adiutrix sp.]
MMTTIELKTKVLLENEKAHDAAAFFHTRAVPYQSRVFTRNYIWNIIKEQFRKNNISVKNADVLEIGCGTGTFVKLFLKLDVGRYTGIDISKEMIKI